MKAKDMFLQYCKEYKIENASYDAWAFGTNADTLAQKILRGEKTASASAYPCYVHDGSAIPKAGTYSVVLDSRNEAVCVIRTTIVYVCAFDKVAPLHAAKEGEGDGSLSYWRKVHERFFEQELQAIGQQFDRAMPVVCEEFECVYPIFKEDER